MNLREIHKLIQVLIFLSKKICNKEIMNNIKKMLFTFFLEMDKGIIIQMCIALIK